MATPRECVLQGIRELAEREAREAELIATYQAQQDARRNKAEAKNAARAFNMRTELEKV